MIPRTPAGRWIVERTRWDNGMRGFFVRINNTAGPEDMLNHVLAIEDEAFEMGRATTAHEKEKEIETLAKEADRG
jgi:hypothetical protein